MKLFALALLIAAVAAEDVARSPRSAVGWGNGWANGWGVGVGNGLGGWGHGLGGWGTWGNGVVASHAAVPLGLHGIHRRSLVAPALVGTHGVVASPAWVGGVGHGWHGGIVAPAVVGVHGVHGVHGVLGGHGILG